MRHSIIMTATREYIVLNSMTVLRNSKNADKAKKMVPMSDGDKTLTYLTAQDKNPMLPDGRELGPKLSIINLGEATTAEIDLSDGSAKKVNLSANSFLENEIQALKNIISAAILLRWM